MKSSLCASKIKDKLSRFHYFGYPNQIPDLLINKIPSNINYNSKIAIVNDFGLEIISKLIELGYSNLYILCTEENDKLYSIIEYMIEKEFNFSRDRIVRLTNIDMNDKFDLVIANPPYEIGNAVIAETMRHCDEAMVLMPISCYKKKENGLYKKIASVEQVDSKIFKDATIAENLSICCLNNSLDNGLNYGDIEVEAFDSKWKKYYLENLKRNCSWDWVDGDCSKLPKEFNPKIFYLTVRTIVDGVHKTFNCADYQMNFNHKYTYTKEIAAAIFKTKVERDNIVDFWYNSKIMTSICKASHKQGGSGTSPIFLPRVDWTKPWTDEEILKDYGYTNEEIKEILK